MRARLTGSTCEPRLEITVRSGDRHTVTGAGVDGWIRQLANARRIATTMGTDQQIESSTWQLRTLDDDAEQALTAAGYSLPENVDQLRGPLAGLHPTRPGWARVLPRLTDVLITGGLLPDSARYDAGSRSWDLPIADLIGVAGVTLSAALHRALTGPPQTTTPTSVLAEPISPTFPIPPPKTTTSIPTSTATAVQLLAGSDGTVHPEAVQQLIRATGGIPAWFGLDLDPFQQVGALCMAAGHRLCGDAPGLGKTRQMLAAAAMVTHRRVIILTPPTVVTHWSREAIASGLADHPGGEGGEVFALRASRKIPALPDHGVLIVPDTLIASRPALLAELVAWRPDVVALDEAHRIKTWNSKRGLACRTLARFATTLRIAASGTPMFANTEELAGPLDFADLLGPVFGGYSAFTGEYARLGKFGWTTQKRKLPQLKRMLDARCWVRRTKHQVMKNLPAKRRVAEYIDVDTKLFTAAHAEVNRKVDVWLRQFSTAKGRMPGVDEIDEWTQGQVGLVTLMRKAAGLAKVPVAVEMVTDWVRDTTEEDADGNPVFTRPLIVWTHHHEVSEAMATALPISVGQTRSIVGGTPQDERTQIVDDFQAGLIPVLVASIHAAGVGITLTRSSDAWMVESDWTNSIISQAEDRIHRRGASRPVTITTLIAPGTLDEQIQQTLVRKATVLDAVMTGADHHVATAAQGDDFSPGASILAGIVRRRIENLEKSRRAKRAPRELILVD